MTGGYPGDEEKARELFPKLDQPKVREDFSACANYIRTRPDCTGKTTPRYDAVAAKLAWERTIAHFNKYVRG